MANNTEKTAGNVATLQPAKPLIEDAKQEPEDDGLRTVLLGWGRVAPTYRQRVDHYVFIGGVCRNVLAEDAEAMVATRHPKKREGDEPRDKEHSRKVGYIRGHILPNNATEAHFVKATGIQPMPVQKLANMLHAYTPEEIKAAMGDKSARAFAEALLATFGK